MRCVGALFKASPQGETYRRRIANPKTAAGIGTFITRVKEPIELITTAVLFACLGVDVMVRLGWLKVACWLPTHAFVGAILIGMLSCRVEEHCGARQCWLGAGALVSKWSNWSDLAVEVKRSGCGMGEIICFRVKVRNKCDEFY